MRVNIYAEELPALLDSTLPNDKLHHNQTDDDRSAITFWVPWTELDGNNFEKLCVIFTALHDAARKLATEKKGER